jgi:hypothetical protein
MPLRLFYYFSKFKDFFFSKDTPPNSRHAQTVAPAELPTSKGFYVQTAHRDRGFYVQTATSRLLTSVTTPCAPRGSRACVESSRLPTDGIDPP